MRQQDLPDAGRPRHLEQFTRQRGGVEAMDGVEDKPSSGDKLPCCLFQSTIATFAPAFTKASAVERPIPEAAPVTKAILFWKLKRRFTNEVQLSYLKSFSLN